MAVTKAPAASRFVDDALHALRTEDAGRQVVLRRRPVPRDFVKAVRNG
jgi:hypothetical protein